MSGRRVAATWTVVAVGLLLLASACTFGQGTSSAGGGGSSGGPIQLRMWAHRGAAFNQALRDAARAYEKIHPNVTITLETFNYDDYIQTLQTALPAGNAADIIHMFGTWACSYVDLLAPVPKDVITLPDAQDKFFAGPLGGYTCDDTLYGLPQESNVEYGATLVNTKMAQAAGTSTTGWDSWSDFIADAKKLTIIQDGVITRAGYNFTAGDGLAHSLLSLIVEAGGNYLNADGTAYTFDTPEGHEALGLLKQMADAPVVDPVLFNDVENWVGDCYFTELCAMGLVGPWVVADYADDYPDVAANTVYAKLPAFHGSNAFIADSGWGLTVAKDSPYADVAWDFAKFAALDADNAAQWNLTSGTLPALKENGKGEARDRLVAEFPHFEAWFDILPNAQFVGQLPDRDKLYYDIIQHHGLAALRGDETIDEALKAIQTEGNETFG